MIDQRMQSILDYWFADLNEKSVLDEDLPAVKKWFGHDPATDEYVIKNFSSELNKARKGKFEGWMSSAQGRLALILVFDQFSRHIGRGTAKAYENDFKALEICLPTLKERKDEKLALYERQFLYMPLMHAETPALQRMSCEKYKELLSDAKEHNPHNEPYFVKVLDYARQHADIIKRFGRFPHRNQALGRRSTPEESTFLEEGKAAFT